MKLKKYKWMIDNWELVAVVIAGFLGLVLHAIGVIHDDTILISLILFLLCLYIMRDMSFETANEERIKGVYEKLKSIESRLEDSEVELILPQNIASATNEFYSRNRGEIWMFNMCMKMYGKKELFNRVLKPIIDGENAKDIQFIVDNKEKDAWNNNVIPLINECKNKKKVLPPIFSDITEPIAFQMIRTGDEKDLREALISIWGEPFMAGHGRDGGLNEVHHPRYVFHIKSHSEIIPRLKELFLRYKLTQ